MAKLGLIAPERQVRWLHIPQGGYCECTVVSPLYSYQRHWTSAGPTLCNGKNCELCKQGIPWRARYVMKVEADDGEWMLELGAPQYHELVAIEQDGGICGCKLRLKRSRAGATAKIVLEKIGRVVLQGAPEDLQSFVDSVESQLVLPSRRK